MKKVTRKVKSVVMIVLVGMLIGATLLFCRYQLQHQAKDDPHYTGEPVTKAAPFNTLLDAKGWGDEADFLRIVDMDVGESIVYAPEFEGYEFAMTDERTYGFVIYSHNTSISTQTDLVLTLSYPEVFVAGETNTVNAYLSWGGDKPGVISDSLELDVQVNISPCPVDDDDDCVLITDFNSGGMLKAKPAQSSRIDGVVTHTIPLPDMPADSALVTFFVIDAIPAL